MANKTFDKYVHKIGRFWLEGKDDIPFAAQIVCANSFNYELVGSMIKHDSITEIRKQQNELQGVTLFGVVEGDHISLFNCRIKCSSRGADNARWGISATFTFGDAIIGTTFVTHETNFSAAIVRFERMGEFIDLRICNSDLLEGQITLKHDELLKHNTERYNLEFMPRYGIVNTNSKTEFHSFADSKFIFLNKICFEEIQTHIFQFRMLLSLLKLHHIDIDNIDLYVNWGEPDKDYRPKNEFHYHLNYMPVVSTEKWPVPSFCLQYDLLRENFTKILNGWFCFLEEAGPIVELFYQILIDKVHDINLFLNSTQAIEVFSNIFRKEEARQLLTRCPRKLHLCSYTGKVCQQADVPTLRHKALDLLDYANCCFKFDILGTEKIASWIVDTRNYYTHYGRKSKNVLTKYEDRGPVNRLMQYLLTILIYNKLGIEMDLIADKFYHTFYKSTLQQVKAMLNRKSD